jgi:hypothetical protein
MPQTEFFNANLNRTYPLVDSAQSDPYQKLMAGARFIIRTDVGYKIGYDSLNFVGAVVLNANYEVDNVVVIPQGISALFELSLKFNTQRTHPAALCYLVASFGVSVFKYKPTYATLISKKIVHQAAGFSAYPVDVTPPKGSVDGWVIMGEPDAWFTASELITPLQVEPALVAPVLERASGAGRGKVYIYNRRRTTYIPEDDCEHAIDYPLKPDIGEVIDLGPEYRLIAETDLPVRFVGGHNSLVSHDGSDGIITVSGNRAGGSLGPLCELIPFDEEEEAIDDRDLDGALNCSQVLRSINGIQGPTIDIRALDGVQVGNHPDLNRVIIGILGSGLTSCPSFDTAEQVEFLPKNDDDINCGANDTEPTEPPPPDRNVDYQQNGPAVSVSKKTNVPKSLAYLFNDGVKQINCGTFATWKAEKGSWKLLDYRCFSPCGASEPDRPPKFEDEVVNTSCLNLPTNEYGVRNADFIETPEFKGWETYGNVEVIYEHEKIDLKDMPVVKLQTINKEKAQIYQKFVNIKPKRKYKLFVDCFVEEGEILISIVENDSVSTSRLVTVNTGLHRLEFGSISTSVNNPDLIICCLPNANGSGLAYVSRPGFMVE